VFTRQFNFVILLVLSCFSFAATGNEQPGDEHLLKAVFIYNFAKFTRWPDDAWDDINRSLRICFVGEDSLTAALVRLHGRTLRDNPVIIKQILDTTNLDQCHVLYLADSLQYEALEIVDSIRSKPILTISEQPGFSESGGMIELYQSDDRIRFKVNLLLTREADLDLSSRLLKLAVIVN
jgi:hypothetical protein